MEPRQATQKGVLLKLLVVNPNTTEAMTDKVVAAVRGLVGGGVDVRGVTATFGSEVIASAQSFSVGADAALAAWKSARDWPDAILLACFGDPGLAGLRQASGLPVAGMAESALQEAHAMARPWRIITAGAGWAPLLRNIARAARLDEYLEDIVTLDNTGLAVLRHPSDFLAPVQQHLDDADRVGVKTVVLGGAGFAGLIGQLRYPGLLIDGVEAAVRALGRSRDARAAGFRRLKESG